MFYSLFFFFFFNDTATTEIYTLSLHDALPISSAARTSWAEPTAAWARGWEAPRSPGRNSRRSPKARVLRAGDSGRGAPRRADGRAARRKERDAAGARTGAGRIDCGNTGP